MMSRKIAIQLEHIYKRYPKAVRDTLKDVSLTIEQGCIYGLLGPNGAGKTTLISIMCGIFAPTSGKVQFYHNAVPISDKAKRFSLGYIPQDFAFYAELSLRQNLHYFGAMYQLSSEKIQSRINDLMPVLGLEKVLDEKVGNFSGGMKRRVNLALGILHEPTFIFLDEPTVGVDVQSKNSIIQFLKSLHTQGATILYTSHHLAEAQEFCQQIALIDHGQVLVEGEINALMASHQYTDLQSMFIGLTGEAFRD